MGQRETPLIADAGTYALILRSRSRQPVQIGRWGIVDLGPGYYVYVGSAHGPGGVKARIRRHYRKTKRTHWHIDYLREAVSFARAWISYSPSSQEHRLMPAGSRSPASTHPSPIARALACQPIRPANW